MVSSFESQKCPSMRNMLSLPPPALFYVSRTPPPGAPSGVASFRQLNFQVSWSGPSVHSKHQSQINAVAVMGYDGGTTSATAWMDKLRLTYAEFIHSYGVQKVYVPPHHDSLATHNCGTMAGSMRWLG